MQLTTTLSLVATSMAMAAAAASVGVTPHDQYSSSVGVLGCRIDTNRVAYWPQAVDCNNICVKVTHAGREVHLLRVDQSGGAYDISYDAWNYLATGASARDKPTAGAALDAEFVNVPAAECAGLIHTQGSKLALSASNSMNFLSSCLAQPDSFVAKNFILYNIQNAVCTSGFDEVCVLPPGNNQATCPHQLGTPNPLTSAPVFNILYPSGKTVKAQ